MNVALEQAIENVGRDRVFMRALSFGWRKGNNPPEWVWWSIVHEIQQGAPPPVSQFSFGQEMLSNLFGFG